MNRDRRAPVFLGINAQRLTRDHAQTEEWSRRTLRRNVVPIQLRGIVKRSTDTNQQVGPTDMGQQTWTSGKQEDHDGEGEEE
jgi:hypothetical protein